MEVRPNSDQGHLRLLGCIFVMGSAFGVVLKGVGGRVERKGQRHMTGACLRRLCGHFPLLWALAQNPEGQTFSWSTSGPFSLNFLCVLPSHWLYSPVTFLYHTTPAPVQTEPPAASARCLSQSTLRCQRTEGVMRSCGLDVCAVSRSVPWPVVSSRCPTAPHLRACEPGRLEAVPGGVITCLKL